MEEVLTDSGIASSDSDTHVGSDIFSDYSQTSTLKAEIMHLKSRDFKQKLPNQNSGEMHE